MKTHRSPSSSGRSRDKQRKRLALFQQVMRTPWALEAACRQYLANRRAHHDFAVTRRGWQRRQERRFVIGKLYEAFQ